MAKRSLQVTGAASVVVLALVAAGCGSSGSNSASSTTPATTAPATTTTPGGSASTAGFQAFQTCLAQHGVKNFTPGAGRPPGGGAPGAGTPGANRTPAQQQAFTVCRSKLPAGGLRGRGGPGRSGRPGAGSSNPAFAKYTACLKQHGVTLGASNNQQVFAKASTACAKYRPTASGGAATQ
jgi:hypothetical protein